MAVDDRRRVGVAGLRIAPWQGRHDIAVVAPVPDRRCPGPEDLIRQVRALAAEGTRRVITTALGAAEVPAFEAAGFVPHETLHLMRHDLGHLPSPQPGVRVRRGRRSDHRAVLDLDARAFDAFWKLDRRGLHDARRATVISRYRVSVDRSGAVTGYTVTGRSQGRGYLQRLAVDPTRHRQGFGWTLLADSLRWLAASGARSAVVNTQQHNRAAVALYEAAGFEHEPTGLTVMRLDIEPSPW